MIDYDRISWPRPSRPRPSRPRPGRQIDYYAVYYIRLLMVALRPRSSANVLLLADYICKQPIQLELWASVFSVLVKQDYVSCGQRTGHNIY